MLIWNTFWLLEAIGSKGRFAYHSISWVLVLGILQWYLSSHFSDYNRTITYLSLHSLVYRKHCWMSLFPFGSLLKELECLSLLFLQRIYLYRLLEEKRNSRYLHNGPYDRLWQVRRYNIYRKALQVIGGLTTNVAVISKDSKENYDRQYRASRNMKETSQGI